MRVSIITDDGPAEVDVETFMDAMLRAQESLGQITWVDLQDGLARGEYGATRAIGNRARVAVVELSHAADGVVAAEWVHG